MWQQKIVPQFIDSSLSAPGGSNAQTAAVHYENLFAINFSKSTTTTYTSCCCFLGATTHVACMWHLHLVHMCTYVSVATGRLLAYWTSSVWEHCTTLCCYCCTHRIYNRKLCYDRLPYAAAVLYWPAAVHYDRCGRLCTDNATHCGNKRRSRLLAIVCTSARQLLLPHIWLIINKYLT